MRKHWDSTDEEAYREAKALEKATANEIRRRASHARHEELMPGLEKLEHHAAMLCGDIEFFGKAGVGCPQGCTHCVWNGTRFCPAP